MTRAEMFAKMRAQIAAWEAAESQDPTRLHFIARTTMEVYLADHCHAIMRLSELAAAVAQAESAYQKHQPDGDPGDDPDEWALLEATVAPMQALCAFFAEEVS